MRFVRGVLTGALVLACTLVSGQRASGLVDTEVVDAPVMGIGAIELFVDASGIRGPEGFTRQEIYLLLDAAQLEFTRDGDEYVAELTVHVVLTDSTGAEAENVEWQRRISVDDPKEIVDNGVPYTDVMGFDLKPGVYDYRLSVTDTRAELSGTCKAKMLVREFEGEALTVSDLEVAVRVEEAPDEAGRFGKHGWRVVPNVTRTFPVNGTIRFYVEIYRLSPAPERVVEAEAEVEGKATGPASAETSILGYTLTDTLGNTVRKYPPVLLIKPGASVVKVDSLSLDGIERGSYKLRAEVLDRGNRQVARTERLVFVSEQRKPPELSAEQKDQLRYYADIRYVASDKDLELYKKLKSSRARMRLLRRVWKELDPTPATPENERLAAHIARMEYAESSFAAGRGKRGSDTDKGRIYIKYGPASDIQYNLADQTEKPFEIWAYDTSGGYQFIFQDRRGAGIFELVHSTHPKEFYNPTWRNY